MNRHKDLRDLRVRGDAQDVSPIEEDARMQRWPATREERAPSLFDTEFDAASMRGMVSFRYASTEVFSEGGQVHVRMKQARYQDGRLHKEECEGTIDRAAAERMVVQAQQQFINQAFGFARLLLAPFFGLPRRRD